jgi:hypothetical protein
MDASILYEEMKMSNEGAPNFAEIKLLFEHHYDCLGVTCEEIGGLYDADTGEYLEGAEACGQRRTSSKKKGRSKDRSTGSATSMLFGFGRGFLICNLVVFGILIANRNRWIPAASSQADLWVSAATRRLHQLDYNPSSNNDRSYNVQDMELSDSTNYHQIPEEEHLEL